MIRLVLLCVVLVGAVACSPTVSASPLVTGTVQRGSVVHTVTATGALSGVTSGGATAVVPFEEAGAALLQAGQPVRMTFDAIPELTVGGNVLAVAPDAVTISGVTNYYATIVTDSGDPRLRAGQTTDVSVETTRLDNVLVVPNKAVTRADGQSYVTVLGPDGTPAQVSFVAGAVGNDTTQVLSGLHEGQEVAVNGPAQR